MTYKEEQLALTEKAEERFLRYLGAYKQMLSEMAYGYEPRLEKSIQVFKTKDFLESRDINEHFGKYCIARPFNCRETLRQTTTSFAKVETSLPPLLIEDPHTLRKREFRGTRSYYGIIDSIQHNEVLTKDRHLDGTDLQCASIPNLLRRHGIEVEEKRMVMEGDSPDSLQRPQDILVINRVDSEYLKKLNAVNSDLEEILEAMQNDTKYPGLKTVRHVDGLKRREEKKSMKSTR